MNYTKLQELVKSYAGQTAEQIAAALAEPVEIDCDFRLSYQSALDACGLLNTRKLWDDLDDTNEPEPLDPECDEFVFAIQNGYAVELNTPDVQALLDRLHESERLPQDTYELLKSFTRRTVTVAEKEGVAGANIYHVRQALAENAKAVQE